MALDFLTQSLSNRQYSLLKECDSKGGLSLDRVLELSQTTSGSVVRRGFIAWSEQQDCFLLTSLGIQTLDFFENTDIGRNAIDRPLSSFILAKNRGLVSRSKQYLQHNKELVRERKKHELVDRKGKKPRK